jgi:hypothetical protein
MDKKAKLDSPDDNGDQVREVKLRDCGPVTLSDKEPTIKPFEVAVFSKPDYFPLETRIIFFHGHEKSVLNLETIRIFFVK